MRIICFYGELIIGQLKIHRRGFRVWHWWTRSSIVYDIFYSEGGYKVAYDKEIPVEVRSEIEGKSLSVEGTLEMLRMRILVLTQ